MHSKMDFSPQNLEQKRPVYLQYAQCSGLRETTHTWLGGEGFPGAVGVLEGCAMVMTNFHIELGIAKCLIYTIFYAFELVPVSENGHPH
jgi:hypothetical protein